MNPLDTKSYDVLPGSAHLDEILAEHPTELALPKEAADDLIATAFIYLQTWYEVYQHFKDGDQLLFGLTGKAHILLHACLLSRCQTPCLKIKGSRKFTIFIFRRVAAKRV